MLMITGVASVGNGTDTLHYAYRSGLNQFETATWRNSQDAVLNSRTYAYDVYHRLTGINLNNISEVAYTLNDKDQRTAVSYAVGGAWSYSYDDKSQVTGASGNNTVFSYAYDGIGNRVTAVEGSDTWSYTSNLLNQYTAINSNQPTYDADGNMLTTGDGWLYTWNGENRLIRAENSDTLVEMAYDYMGRRVEKKVSSKGLLSFYNWNVDKHYKFVYDGYKIIAVYDGLNDNTLVQTFTWQESVSSDIPISMTYDGNVYYYIADGNKNITALVDVDGNRVASYSYEPFGQSCKMEGSIAIVNPFRFSSEYTDEEINLIYYNYRYYNPRLGRWLSRDPLGEAGGENLFLFVCNSPVKKVDIFGQDWLDNVSNFAAGAADALSMGITSWARRRLDIDSVVNYSSGSYWAGEITEVTVEVTLTLGGAALRKHAVKYAGKAGRRMLVKDTRKLRKVMNIAQSSQGQIHHINPIRAGRYPLAFDFAANKSWNLQLVEGARRGFNAKHAAIHRKLRKLDQLDLARAWSQPIRNMLNLLIQHINDAAGNGSISVPSPDLENEKNKCFYAPSIDFEVTMEIYMEYEDIYMEGE